MRMPVSWTSFTAFSQHFVMQVMLELCTLLKVVPNAHPELQTMLIFQQYKPTWLVGGTSAMPSKLDLIRNTAGEWEEEPHKLVYLDTMHCTKMMPGKVSLVPKACFLLGRARLYMCSLTVFPRKCTP